LVLLGSHKPIRNKFFNQSIEDFMSAGRAKKLYTKWFSKDAAKFAKDHGGKTATIGNVLEECLDIFINYESDNDHETIKILDDNVHALVNRRVTDITRAFRRNQEKPDKAEVNLACSWVWLLMIEVPRMIYHAEHLTDVHDAGK
jgi:hypothetical protein